MKKYITFLCIGVVLITSAQDTACQVKKYELKSGIITFNNATTMGKIKFSEKYIVYFDDYGMKECRDTYKDDKLAESFFSDGKTLYALNHSSRIAYKRGDAYRGTEMRFDWNEVSKKDKESGKAKRLPNVTVAGKVCESFESISSSGKTIFAGWKGICLLTDITSSSITVVAKAVKIEENAKIPSEKFLVPAEYKIQ
jgi:hypothetical protein